MGCRIVWLFAILSISWAAEMEGAGNSGTSFKITSKMTLSRCLNFLEGGAVDTKVDRYWPFDGSSYPQDAKTFGGLGEADHPCRAGQRTWDDSWGNSHPCPSPCQPGQATWVDPVGHTWPCPEDINEDWFGSVDFRRLAGNKAGDKAHKSAAVETLEERSSDPRPAFLRGAL